MNDEAAPQRSRRKLSLDALRGIAVFLMIEQHVGIWIWEGAAPGKTSFDYPFLVGFNALGGMAAPLFVSLAGVGSALFVAADRPRTDITLVRRGLVLMLFGVALNFMSPSWFSWGSWFVLHMMGFAMALGPIWRRLPTWALLAGCAAVLCGTIAIQDWLHTPLSLSNARMRNVGMSGGPLRLALAEGQFPIFPWLTFYLAGFVSGRWIQREKTGWVAILGATFLSVGAGGYGLFRAGILSQWLHPTIANRAFGLRLSFFPASIAIAALLLGGALLLISLVTSLERKKPLQTNNPLVALGRGSLTLLMFHVPVFRDLSRPIGLWRGLDATTALITVFALVFVCVALTRLWQRIDYRYGAEWLLRKIAG